MRVNPKDPELNRTAYYQECRALAQAKRLLYSVETASLNLRVMQRIYKAEGITIDRRKLKGRRIKAAYYCEGGDCSVLIETTLPREPKLFALAHELKHHYLDQDQIRNNEIECGDYNAQELIEKGAEVFAAEFIYPEAEMRAFIGQSGLTSLNTTPERIVKFKRECGASVSYTFIVKRFVRFGLCPKGKFAKIQFVKLEEKMFGLPIHKREWFKKQRARKKMLPATETRPSLPKQT
jgi:Zn-dependent peptidase ImmA (M78 family)